MASRIKWRWVEVQFVLQRPKFVAISPIKDKLNQIGMPMHRPIESGKNLNQLSTLPTQVSLVMRMRNHCILESCTLHKLFFPIATVGMTFNSSNLRLVRMSMMTRHQFSFSSKKMKTVCRKRNLNLVENTLQFPTFIPKYRPLAMMRINSLFVQDSNSLGRSLKHTIPMVLISSFQFSR